MQKLEQAARRRIQRSSEQQQQTIAAVRQGRPLEAEFDSERIASRQHAESFVATKAVLPSVVGALETVGGAPGAPGGAERIWGNTVDFVGVAFLQQGAHAARAVGRVAWRDGRAQGSGFLVAPGLFLTNNHVIGSELDAGQFVLEFDYEIDPSGQRRNVTRFELAPLEFFITDDTDDLDYTLIAVGPRIGGSEELDAFGFNPMSAAGNKHTLGEVANIVQHPDGRLKEVVLRENRLVSRLSHVLHYVADTEPGSSGSPVFNNQWQAIALHHWGGPWRQTHDTGGLPVPRFVNEGVRISAIAGELQDRRDELAPAQQARLDQALMLGESTDGLPQAKPASGDDDAARVRIRSDGTAVWRVPIEIAVGVPGVPGLPSSAVPPAAGTPGGSTPVGPRSEAFRRKLDKNYDGRKGYRERFLSGHVIPMPTMKSAVQARLAKNLDAQPGEDPHEFLYQHFSSYVDGTRGLPLVTACNIDGKNLKSINRKTGKVTVAESIPTEALPEGREKWYDDPRISRDQCGDDELYTSQRVSAGHNRLGRIFHRGHMVRRLDPCWGDKTRALRAEADTFHFTNCTPQVGKFNSGRTLWQGIENHVLDNAKVHDLRVSVFTGTVLDDANDPPYRDHIFPGFKVPMQFWKIAVWKDGGALSALAMLADQSDSLPQLPESAEALDDDDGVREFVTTVIDIEELTGLDFGTAVRDADLYERVEGPESLGGRSEVRAYREIPLKRGSRSRRQAAKKRGAAKKKAAKKRGAAKKPGAAKKRRGARKKAAKKRGRKPGGSY